MESNITMLTILNFILLIPYSGVIIVTEMREDIFLINILPCLKLMQPMLSQWIGLTWRLQLGIPTKKTSLRIFSLNLETSRVTYFPITNCSSLVIWQQVFQVRMARIASHQAQHLSIRLLLSLAELT